MPELPMQLNLFLPGGPPRRVCSHCRRPEEEAPIHFINELGRFCLDCRRHALRWPPATGMGTSSRLVSSSLGESSEPAEGERGEEAS